MILFQDWECVFQEVHLGVSVHAPRPVAGVSSSLECPQIAQSPILGSAPRGQYGLCVCFVAKPTAAVVSFLTVPLALISSFNLFL